MSCLQYWPVGSLNDVSLSLTQADICRFLVADWLPTLPFAVSRSVLGWPYYLLSVDPGTKQYLILNPLAGWTERQWKVMLSWMIGIAGTRRVLAEEQYQWIAPLSAFYPNRRQAIMISFWNPGYPPSVLQIVPDPSNGSRLRPDYITALALPNRQREFALVESKGTGSSLNRMRACPSDWANQARNAVVIVNDSPVTFPRHFVVATRCNPNGVRP
jgi:hypothetical protein